MYGKMPFGSINAGATSQRVMNIAFAGEKKKLVVIYLDQLIVFSKLDEVHIKHLKQTFEKCRKFGLSLNPKKSLYAMEDRKLLGHIVIDKGICIDLERVEAIQKINIPRNKKEVQSFLGKVKFLRRFVPNFVEIVKNITSMLKKGHDIKWDCEPKNAFAAIKLSLSKAPVLASPYFSKEFITFS